MLGGAVNPELGGLFYQPTLLTGAAPGSEIMTEEGGQIHLWFDRPAAGWDGERT